MKEDTPNYQTKWEKKIYNKIWTNLTSNPNPNSNPSYELTWGNQYTYVYEDSERAYLLIRIKGVTACQALATSEFRRTYAKRSCFFNNVQHVMVRIPAWKLSSFWKLQDAVYVTKKWNYLVKILYTTSHSFWAGTGLREFANILSINVI